ncbi:unnamed protein product [Urochloa decumbens]|uniref:Uncharacterized protein n=1 Tax=Urochloa decumbens TaxID=240449 RepID=A0ABC9GWR8_9POAL
MIVNCSFVKSIWHRISLDFNLPQLHQRLAFRNIRTWWHTVTTTPSAITKAQLQAIIYSAWNIWKERCRRVFDNKAITANQLIDLINQDVAAYKAARESI